MTDFDRVAGAYRWLEYLAFGPALQRARTAHLGALATCKRILVVGDGDGRCVARLVDLAPRAHVHVIDTSERMLHLAARRLPAHARGRATFERIDVRGFDPGHEPWDAILTMFVLDCFTTEDVNRLARRLAPALRPGGLWLFADFVVPPHGWRRLRARLWLALLYRFFRWQAGLEVSEPPASEAALESAGLVAVDVHDRQAGLLRSVSYRRPA